MEFNRQPTLQDARVILRPLTAADFEALYAVASDPAVWEQHPNKERWQEPVFQRFFEGAMDSEGAFLILDAQTGAVLGSTRYYEYDEKDSSVFMGYTFFGTNTWGTGVNKAVKTLLLNYAFQHVSQVYFHIGSNNFRSQKAIAKFHAQKIGEEEIAYVGEASRWNFKYSIKKEDWLKSQQD